MRDAIGEHGKYVEKQNIEITDMKHYILLLLLLATLPAAAQKIQKVCGEYTYYVPENVSRSAAMRTALERAKIQALADEFGTIVSQTNTSIVKDNNGQADSRFFSLGSTRHAHRHLPCMRQGARNCERTDGVRGQSAAQRHRRKV